MAVAWDASRTKTCKYSSEGEPHGSMELFQVMDNTGANEYNPTTKYLGWKSESQKSKSTDHLDGAYRSSQAVSCGISEPGQEAEVSGEACNALIH